MYSRTNIIFLCLCMFAPIVSHADDVLPLDDALNATRAACSGIDNEMKDLKKMAGINTAVTAVGTAAGGVALGTGIAKAKVDVKAEELEAEIQEEIEKLNKLAAEQKNVDVIPIFDPAIFNIRTNSSPDQITAQQKTIKEKQEELDALTQKSKTLGNVRTGTMAGATVADTASAIIASKNKVDTDLQTKIDNCKASLEVLSKSIMQAKINGEDTAKAQHIVDVCSEYSFVDISPINKRAKGAMVSSIVGATTGLAGTVTSAMANTDKTRNDNTEEGKKKEKNLNTASNVLAGTTTVASGVATVFNATQISAIKRVAKVAEECEGALD